MDKHPCGWIIFQLSDEQQTANGSYDINGAKATVGALYPVGFVEMPDKDNRTSGSLGDIAQAPEDRTHLIGTVHVYICAKKCLYRVDDNEPCMVFLNSSRKALVRQSERLLLIVNDNYPVKVGFRFQQSGLYRVSQTVLGCLIDDIERLQRSMLGSDLRLVQAATRRMAK